MLNWLFRQGHPRPKPCVLAGDQARRPVSRQCDAELRGEVAETAADGIPSEDHMAICEMYWDRMSRPATSEKDIPSIVEGYRQYVLAVNALGNRGTEIHDWARRLLIHTDYDARETGAWLIGELGKRGQLGDAIEGVVEELAALVDRPIEEDSKESQAIDAAIISLGKTGHPKAIPILRHVLTSGKREHDGDTAWTAAETLSMMTGEPFMEASDPVEAARAWSRAHPAG
jgi:hypothetical protein